MPTRGQPKGLSLRSRGAFCEGKRQAPLCEAQALSLPLASAARMSAMAHAPYPVKNRRSQYQTTPLRPLGVIAGLNRDLLHPWTTPIVQKASATMLFLRWLCAGWGSMAADADQSA